MSYMVGFHELELILSRDPGQYESSILEFLTTQYTWDQNIYEVTQHSQSSPIWVEIDWIGGRACIVWLRIQEKNIHTAQGPGAI